MKITLVLIFLGIWMAHYSAAQINSTMLEHNNVSAHISDAGTYFFDYTTQERGYEVPKGSGRHAIYTTQFWFAAKDAADEIHFVQGGAPTEGSDVFNGPISGVGTYNTPDYQNDWGNSMWTFCQAELDEYKLSWLCSLDPDCVDEFPLVTNDLINRINTWPAHGDVSSGQSFYMAPFFDYNSDGIYDPSQGDYPIIKGCCAVYMIQNDAAESHSYTYTDSVGIELHILFYHYQTLDYLNDVTFVDVMAINRSTTDYPEFIHSIVVDAKIGNDTDDYYGCDSASNTMYFYNADNNDEDGVSDLGYGIDPPAIGIVSLNGNMTSCVPYTNSGLTVSEKWNLMKGLQYTGSPWIDPNSNETNYVFSGNPNLPSEWSALSSGSPTDEAKGISSLDWGSFNSGDTLKQSYAITYARDGNNLENVQSIINLATDVKSFYDNESAIPCEEGTWNLEELNDLSVTIFPNPSTGIVSLSNHDKSLLSLTVYDAQGKILKELPSSNKNTIEIDLSSQRSGIYFFHIKTQKSMVVKRIVVY